MPVIFVQGGILVSNPGYVVYSIYATWGAGHDMCLSRGPLLVQRSGSDRNRLRLRTMVEPRPLRSFLHSRSHAKMKYSIVYLLVIVLLSGICASLAGDNETKCPVSKCPMSFCALEKALYETDHNVLKILSIFSPARNTVPSFVRVNYTFQDENKEYSNNCNVSYLWVKGGFLFVQPPTIFQFSSLFFYFTELRDKDEFTLNLTLPYECSPLIWNGTNCTCHTLDDKSNNSLYSPLALEELTKQVRL